VVGDLIVAGHAVRRLPEAWIAPGEIRDLRELTRCRQKLVGLPTSCKDQVHAVLAKLGVPVTCTDIFGVAGSAWLDQLRLPQPYAGKITSLRQLAGELSAEITMLSGVIGDLFGTQRPPAAECRYGRLASSWDGSRHAYIRVIGLPLSRAGSPPGGGTSRRSTQTPPRAV
jgi:hypothetical protein